MTSSNREMAAAWRRLLALAHAEGVQVHLIPGDSCGGVDWEGLYIVHPVRGRGIALRDDLPPDRLVWVLAHEIGHRMAWLNPYLFPPFSITNEGQGSTGLAAHLEWTSTRRRLWRTDPDEQRADEWAARELIDKERWREAEDQDPLDLHAIADSLRLPIQAVLVWERMRRQTSQSYVQRVPIQLDRQQRTALREATDGQGGHQSLFRRIQSKRRGGLGLTFADFSLARERLLKVRGGWRYRYECVVKAVLPSIVHAGGVSALFGLE